MASKTWYCHNRSCGAPLGVTVDGELSVQSNNPNVQIICTEGAILNLQCSKCGRINKWVPKDSALIAAVLKTHLIETFVNLITKQVMGIKQAVVDPEAEPEEVDEE